MNNAHEKLISINGQHPLQAPTDVSLDDEESSPNMKTEGSGVVYAISAPWIAARLERALVGIAGSPTAIDALFAADCLQKHSAAHRAAPVADVAGARAEARGPRIGACI